MIPTICESLPTGMDSRDYEKFQDYSEKQLAWEFLRRQPKFQQACQDLPNDSEKSAMNKAAREFGLIRFKHYLEPFGSQASERPRFRSSSVWCWSRISETIYQNLQLPKRLRKGEVLIKFDLNVSTKTSRSLDAQLCDAKKKLESRQEKWLAKLNEESNTSKIKADLVGLLRLIDLVNHLKQDQSIKMNRAQIIEHIYEGNSSKYGHTPDRYFQKKYKVATNYMEFLYHDLAAS